MWKTDVGFLLSFDDLLLAILDVDAVGRGVLYPLAAEIIGGTVGRAGCAYRPDGRAGVVLGERITLSVVSLDFQRCCSEFHLRQVKPAECLEREEKMSLGIRCCSQPWNGWRTGLWPGLQS